MYFYCSVPRATYKDPSAIATGPWELRIQGGSRPRPGGAPGREPRAAGALGAQQRVLQPPGGLTAEAGQARQWADGSQAGAQTQERRACSGQGSLSRGGRRGAVGRGGNR